MRDQPIDIIIVNYNSTDYAIKCIDSITTSANSLKTNIVVIDNGSFDYPERVKKSFPNVHLILNNENFGFAKAINSALKKTSSDTVTIVNPDTVILNGFFKKAVQYLNVNQNVAIVGPQILDFDGSVQGSARKFPTVLTSIFGRKSPLTKFFPNNPVTKREFVCFNILGKDPVEVDWVSGACMVIRRKAIDEVGGFDERYFMYWEDTDLCKELQDIGWRIVYLPEAKIYHHVGISSNSKPTLSIYNFHKSCYLLCRKHAKGLKRCFIPLVLFGLAIRCLLVVGLNRLSSLNKKTQNYNRKEK